MAMKHLKAKKTAEELEDWTPAEELKGLTQLSEQALAGLWLPLRRALLSRVAGRLATGGLTPWVPEVDVEETPKEYIVSAALPGLEKKDIHVEVTETGLTLRGERPPHADEGDGCRRREQAYGKFYRALRLPGGVKEKEAKAVYKAGILKVTLPKAKESAYRSISVE